MTLRCLSKFKPRHEQVHVDSESELAVFLHENILAGYRSSYLLALQSLQDEGDRVHEEFLAEERLLAQLTHKTKDAFVKHSAILK